MSGSPPFPIVALALDTYGDHVLRQPLLSGLLDAGHAVTVVVRPAYAAIVPFIDERLSVIECDVDPRQPIDRMAWAPLHDAVAAIAQASPALVACLPYNRTLADEWLLRSCDFCERIAFFPGNRPDSLIDADLPAEHQPPLAFDAMVTRAVDADEWASELEKNGRLLHAIAPSQRAEDRPRLSVPAQRLAAADAWIRTTPLAGRPFVVVAPAGTQNTSLKRLPVSLAVAAIRRLRDEHGLATVLCGVESERAHLDAVCAAVDDDRNVVRWIGDPGSLGDLLGLLGRAQAYVGADLGTMHFAAAVGLPVVALFGGGHFPRFAPAAVRWAGVTKRLACFGCEWHCMYGSPRCIEEVSPETWLGAIDDVLRGGAPGWVFDPAGLDERAARLVQPAVAQMRSELRLVERDRARRLQVIHAQAAHLADVEADRNLRLEAMRGAERQIIEHERAIAELTARLARAEATLPAIERDRAERLSLIERQHAELETLQARIEEIELDRAQRLAVIERQQGEIERLLAAHAQLESRSAAAAAALEAAQQAAGELSAQLAEADRRLAKLQSVRGALSTLRRAFAGRSQPDQGRVEP